MNYLIDKEQIKNILELFISWNGEIETIDIANLDSAVDFISENFVGDNVEDVKKINGLVKEDDEYYFPELKEKESEDDRIRKAILNYLRKMWDNCKDNVCGVHVEDAIAWIEKQAKHLENYDEAEKEKSAFVGGGFIACKADFLDFKEGETYWLEYIGDDNYNVRSDNLLGKTYHITPGQLYCLFAQQHCPKENNVNEETNAPTAYGKYVDECLNEAAKHFFSEGEDTYTVADLFYAGIRCRQSWLEKQDEQNVPDSSQTCKMETLMTLDEAIEHCKEKSCDDTACSKEHKQLAEWLTELKGYRYFVTQAAQKLVDKVNPKFNEGDWIINKEGKYYQIKDIYNIDGGYYIATDKDGEDNRICFSIVNEYFRLWTIQDAANGDILVDIYGNIGIFKKCYDFDWLDYCSLVNNRGFQYFTVKHGNEKTYPATKEQRELLFQNMKEAGWEWNAEQKEANKIEQKPVDKVESKFRVGNWYQCVKDFFGKGVTFDKNTAYYCAKEGCLQNEYGCHIAIVKDLYDNFKLWSIEDAKDGDVLATSAGAFIYNGNNGGGSPGSYCGINTLGRFQLGSETHWARKKVYPATKEQRDVLFQKMKEADCKWDSEKKELKTIDQKHVDKVKSKFKVDNYIVLNDDISTSSEIWKVINIDKDGYYNIQCITNPEYDEIYRVPGFVIEQDYRLWTIEDAKDGDVLVDEDNNIGLYLGEKDDLYWHSHIYLGCDNCLRGFSIGGYHKHKNTKPATKEQRDLLFQKMKELKRIGKFKVGDWIVSNDGIFTGMITEVFDYGYRDTNGYFNKCLEDNYHLWTIQDAKCGDVLISSNKQPFVYNGNYTSDSLGRGRLGAYFGLNYHGELLITDSHGNNWSDLTGVQPATEEQRNMLFKKLHDSDYKWDSEKKELWHKYL